MATSNKKLKDELRAQYMGIVKEFLLSNDEEVLITGSNEFSIPCVDSEGNDEFLVLTFKIPQGSRDGDAYDGYGLADEYANKCKAQKEKAEQARIAKEQKIARDKAMRAQKAESKAQHKGE